MSDLKFGVDKPTAEEQEAIEIDDFKTNIANASIKSPNVLRILTL